MIIQRVSFSNIKTRRLLSPHLNSVSKVVGRKIIEIYIAVKEMIQFFQKYELFKCHMDTLRSLPTLFLCLNRTILSVPVLYAVMKWKASLLSNA